MRNTSVKIPIPQTGHAVELVERQIAKQRERERREDEDSFSLE
jgi:uncharacterized protein YigA (DUF484 family)